LLRASGGSIRQRQIVVENNPEHDYGHKEGQYHRQRQSELNHRLSSLVASESGGLFAGRSHPAVQYGWLATGTVGCFFHAEPLKASSKTMNGDFLTPFGFRPHFRITCTSVWQPCNRT
jgi:hypothetical protein